jgi:hypothetical protein
MQPYKEKYYLGLLCAYALTKSNLAIPYQIHAFKQTNTTPLHKEKLIKMKFALVLTKGLADRELSVFTSTNA